MIQKRPMISLHPIMIVSRLLTRRRQLDCHTQLVPAAQLGQALDGYSNVIAKTFILTVTISRLAFLLALELEWKNVKHPAEPQDNITKRTKWSEDKI